MVRQVKSWETCVRLGIATVAVVITGAASANALSITSAQRLANCRSATPLPPTRTQIAELQTLMLKYKVPTSDIMIKTTMTRCQFGLLLSTVMDQVNNLIAVGNFKAVNQKDFPSIKHLDEAYATELAAFRWSEYTEERPQRREKQLALTLPGDAFANASSSAGVSPPVISKPFIRICKSTETLPPNHPDIQALKALMRRYHASESLGTVGRTVVTRCQFAAVLSAELESIADWFNAADADNALTLRKEDVPVFEYLGKVYATELAYYPSHYAHNEDRVATLVKEQFAPITQRGGNAVVPKAICMSTKFPPVAPIELAVLQSLMQQYKVTVTHWAVEPAPSRCEFAVALNAVIVRVNELLVAGQLGTAVNLEAVRVIQALYQAYAAELASFHQVEHVTGGMALLTSQQFSIKPNPPTPPSGGSPASAADIQALLAIERRYGCLADQGTRTLTRYAFADALETCLNRLSKVWTTVVSAEDQSTLYRLQAGHMDELNVVRYWAKLVEAQTRKQAQQPFSPTTKLHVETILELSGTAGGNH